MPRCNHRLLQEHQLELDAAIDLAVYRCNSCGFVSLLSLLEDDYYADYVNAPSASPQMQAFLEEQAQEFVQRFELRGCTVLEIGCGDGGFLAKLSEAGAVCVGIEPSQTQREIALAQGLHVHGGLLAAERLLEGAPFDAFATRQVFEHIDDMQGFLAAIRAHLKPGGAGLVEVPNLDILLAQDRFFDFIPEHVNYFSPRTLRLVLELSGFEVLSVDPVQEGEALRALVRRIDPPALDGVRVRPTRMQAEIGEFVKRRRALGERVAVWGAGGKGLSMLAVLAGNDFDLLVDGDPHKHGCFTPVSHLLVSSPELLREHAIGTVLILAPAYRNEILQLLRSRYGFNGTVGIVGPTFEVIEPCTTQNPSDRA